MHSIAHTLVLLHLYYVWVHTVWPIYLVILFVTGESYWAIGFRNLRTLVGFIAGRDYCYCSQWHQRTPIYSDLHLIPLLLFFLPSPPPSHPLPLPFLLLFLLSFLVFLFLASTPFLFNYLLLPLPPSFSLLLPSTTSYFSSFFAFFSSSHSSFSSSHHPLPPPPPPSALLSFNNHSQSSSFSIFCSFSSFSISTSCHVFTLFPFLHYSFQSTFTLLCLFILTFFCHSSASHSS